MPKYATSAIRTVALVGHGAAEKATEAYLSGDARVADRFLSKPFRPTDLQREVAALLSTDSN